MFKCDLMDVIYAQLIVKWREEVEKADECGFQKQLREAEEELTAQSDPQTAELARRYVLAVGNSSDYINFEIAKPFFYFAFKAGMDFQKALDDED